MLEKFLVTDNLTYVLGGLFATLYFAREFLKPYPLVHPILLARQSDLERVRKKQESAVYRNYGTGLMGRVCCSRTIDWLFLLNCVDADDCTTSERDCDRPGLCAA